jgi:hypothetical protein
MLALGEQLTGCLHERVGLGLQVPTTALLDFARALGQSGEEGVDLLTHLGRGAKTGIRRYIFANPVPDGFNRTNRLLPQ